MATQSSILAWRIPRTEEPGGLRSMGSQRVGHDCSNWARTQDGIRFLRLVHGKACGFPLFSLGSQPWWKSTDPQGPCGGGLTSTAQWETEASCQQPCENAILKAVHPATVTCSDDHSLGDILIATSWKTLNWNYATKPPPPDSRVQKPHGMINSCYFKPLSSGGIRYAAIDNIHSLGLAFLICKLGSLIRATPTSQRGSSWKHLPPAWPRSTSVSSPPSLGGSCHRLSGLTKEGGMFWVAMPLTFSFKIRVKSASNSFPDTLFWEWSREWTLLQCSPCPFIWWNYKSKWSSCSGLPRAAKLLSEWSESGCWGPWPVMSWGGGLGRGEPG